MTIDLRCGRWQEALADVGEVDAVICDPPYSARTHEGHDNAVKGGGAPREATRWVRSDGTTDVPVVRRAINYALWTTDDVRAFVSGWVPRCRGWFVAFTSHDLCGAYAEALEDADRYVFAPLPFFSPGSRIRLAGDGPSSWTCWIVVARPKTREMQRWGTLPGGYTAAPEAMPIVGGKPLDLMRAIVRDYSRPGDLICDPCAGGATTLIAAAMEGRRAVGAEMDPATYELARARIAKGHTPDMFAAPQKVKARQADLLPAAPRGVR